MGSHEEMKGVGEMNVSVKEGITGQIEVGSRCDSEASMYPGLGLLRLDFLTYVH